MPERPLAGWQHDAAGSPDLRLGMVWLAYVPADSLARRVDAPTPSCRTRFSEQRGTTKPTIRNIRGCPVANIKSQIKRNRQNDAAHERNKAVKSALKTAIRRFREAAESGDPEEARKLAAAASRKLDKAASAGVIHKNQAANKKSAISKRAASL
jgi:small subunit ribosomal protein S20